MSDSPSSQELAGFMPLDALGPDNLKELAAKARRVQIPTGRHLFREDQDPGGQVFVRRGTVELVRDDGSRRTVEGGTKQAAHAVNAPGSGTQSARARTEVSALVIDADLLDLMLTWDQTGSYHVEDLGQSAGEERDAARSNEDWMSRMLQTECFRRIPPANIQAIFMRMEPVKCSPGEVVIRQGEAGEYFYIIAEGRCLVTRATKAKPDGIRLAELAAGDSFGEEALIADSERNATVTMVSRGTLMRLSKRDFDELLKEPLIQWADYEEAAALAPSPEQWIDVRLPAEHQAGRVRGATNIPLIFLRMKAQKLDASRPYVVYCDTGRRASAAAFLMSDRGFDVRVLRGGMARVPSAALEARPEQGPRGQG